MWQSKRYSTNSYAEFLKKAKGHKKYFKQTRTELIEPTENQMHLTFGYFFKNFEPVLLQLIFISLNGTYILWC